MGCQSQFQIVDRIRPIALKSIELKKYSTTLELIIKLLTILVQCHISITRENVRKPLVF